MMIFDEKYNTNVTFLVKYAKTNNKFGSRKVQARNSEEARAKVFEQVKHVKGFMFIYSATIVD